MHRIDKERQFSFAQAQGTKADKFYLATLYSWLPCRQAVGYWMETLILGSLANKGKVIDSLLSELPINLNKSNEQ